MTLSDEEIARALELCGKATPGPWEWNKHDQLFSDPNADIVLFIEREGDVYGPTADLSVSEEDRAFIASARTLLPSALAALKEERAENGRLRAALMALEDPREPGRFCDHAAEPCPRCETVRALVTPPAAGEGER